MIARKTIVLASLIAGLSGCAIFESPYLSHEPNISRRGVVVGTMERPGTVGAVHTVRPSTFSSRVRMAMQHIDSATARGKMPNDEAIRFKNDYYRILEEEQRAIQENRLNLSEQTRLNRDVERLEAYIFQSQYN